MVPCRLSNDFIDFRREGALPYSQTSSVKIFLKRFLEVFMHRRSIELELITRRKVQFFSISAIAFSFTWTLSLFIVSLQSLSDDSLYKNVYIPSVDSSDISCYKSTWLSIEFWPEIKFSLSIEFLNKYSFVLFCFLFFGFSSAFSVISFFVILIQLISTPKIRLLKWLITSC